MTVVIGTAGHIDHGKTRLLQALTGIDADRLPEERRRGMTIDVGYAHVALADGTELDFVDVPGHDRLIGNMLVGAGEIDAVLLVVAADDGPRAQTIEHLELLDALGVRHGVAAVTKTDLVDPVRAAAVVAGVERLLARTTLAGSAVLPVSSPGDDGLAALRTALIEVRDRVLADRDTTPTGVRLALDRVFTVKGRGTVVTGSLRGGPLDRGARLRLEPGDREARAREVQVHGGPVDSVRGGGRVALNLADLNGPPPVRGDVLTTDPAVRATDRVLAILTPSVALGDRSTATGRSLGAGSTLRLHLGTATVDATLRRGRRDAAELSGGRRVARLKLAHPIAAAVGDRFVARIPSPSATAAGGIVLDAAPPVGPSARRASPAILTELATAWLEHEAGAELGARIRLHGLLPQPADLGSAPSGTRAVAGWLLVEDIGAALDTEVLDLVAARHAAEPLALGAPLAELRRSLVRSLRRRVTATEKTATLVVSGILDALVEAGRLARRGDVLGDPDQAGTTLPPDVAAAMDRLEASLAVPGPPSLAAAVRLARCPPEGVRALEAAGRIVRVDDDLAWAGPTYRDLEATALRLADPGPVTPSALRDATGTSRKYVMALLEDLDRRAVLRRTPDGHVRGPRAPR